MKIGPSQDIIAVQVKSFEKITYEELKYVLRSDELDRLLRENDFEASITGRDGNFDSLSLAADLCGVPQDEMKPGDLTVLFRRLPLVQDEEASFLSARDIADKFVLAVGVYKELHRSKSSTTEAVTI